MRPQEVHGGSGELAVFGQHARELGAEVLCGAGRLMREDEGRIEVALGAVARDADDAFGRGVVAGSVVVDGVFVLGGGAFGAAEDLRLAEEGGGLPQIHALLLAEPQVDLLQVIRAIVAGDAGEVDAHELLHGVDDFFVGGVFVDLFVAVGADDHPAGDVAGGADVPVGDGAGGQHFGDHFVVGTVEVDVVLDPFVEDVLAVVADAVPGVLVEVAEEVG